MSSKNFKITNVDTDAISFCKENEEEFSSEEINSVIKEINDISPEFMVWMDDGYYARFVVLAAKNYIMLTHNGKRTLKGSGLKDQKKEKALRDMLDELINSILKEVNHAELASIYNKYVLSVENLTKENIEDWCTKRTLSEKVYASSRSNETKLLDAIEGTEYVEGDKIWVFFETDEKLTLAEKFTGVYDKEKLYNKLYKCVQIFSSVLPTKEPNTIFLNYGLKRNKNKLYDLKIQNILSD